jgi:hypothetical protein
MIVPLQKKKCRDHTTWSYLHNKYRLVLVKQGRLSQQIGRYEHTTLTLWPKLNAMEYIDRVQTVFSTD